MVDFCTLSIVLVSNSWTHVSSECRKQSPGIWMLLEINYWLDAIENHEKHLPCRKKCSNPYQTTGIVARKTGYGWIINMHKSFRLPCIVTSWFYRLTELSKLNAVLGRNIWVNKVTVRYDVWFWTGKLTFLHTPPPPQRSHYGAFLSAYTKEHFVSLLGVIVTGAGSCKLEIINERALPPRFPCTYVTWCWVQS